MFESSGATMFVVCVSAKSLSLQDMKSKHHRTEIPVIFTHVCFLDSRSTRSHYTKSFKVYRVGSSCLWAD